MNPDSVSAQVLNIADGVRCDTFSTDPTSDADLPTSTPSIDYTADLAPPTEEPDSDYEETAGTTMTDPSMSPWGTRPHETTDTMPPTPTEPDLHDEGEDLDAFDDVLTQDAISNLYNQTLANASYSPTTSHQAYVLRWEWWLNLRHFGDATSFIRACYYLTTTYKNAQSDLRNYYPIRYLYYDNVEYEVGYLTHEIIFRYQIVLELFHLIQRKFLYHQDRELAQTNYVLYMYTNILYQCTDIINICNMMHEIEKKYENYKGKGPFAIEKKDVKRLDQIRNRTKSENDQAIADYKKRLARVQKKLEKERKQRMKEIEKGKVLAPTRFTTKKRKRHWDLYYGWSIEDW